MFDAVELEKRGIPTVTIAHDTFGPVARMLASALGIPDLPIINEPVPESGLVSDDVGEFAKNSFPSLLGALSNTGRGEQ